MRIAVLGGGNGSIAAAGDFTLAGHEVRLWRRDPVTIDEHHRLGGQITVRDIDGTRIAKPLEIVASLEQALQDAELIFCPVPATGQDALSQAVAPHLTPGQVLFLAPGTMGSMLFATAARDAGTLDGIAIAETGTLPWLARKHGFAEVVISTRAVRLPVGVFPLSLLPHALSTIDTAFPGVPESCGDVLSAALMNAGPIIHAPLVVMNAGPLEHFEKWDIHNEGTQPAVRRVTDRLDAERVAIREAFGYGPPHFPLADHYRADGDEWMYNRASRANLVSSGDWREDIVLTEHRYVTEDMRLGLSLLSSLGDLAGVDVPVTKGLLAIGSAICGDNFHQTGRPLSKLGLGTNDKHELQSLLAEGWNS